MRLQDYDATVLFKGNNYDIVRLRVEYVGEENWISFNDIFLCFNKEGKLLWNDYRKVDDNGAE